MWVHVLKKKRSKLEPKSQGVIFVSYEPGSKGYQFWDAAHRHFEISHDVKFKESIFPAKEKSLAPSSDHQFSNETNNDSDSEPGLVTLDHPLIGPTSPGPSAPRAQLLQPTLPPAPPSGLQVNLPDVGTAPTP